MQTTDKADLKREREKEKVKVNEERGREKIKGWLHNSLVIDSGTT